MNMPPTPRKPTPEEEEALKWVKEKGDRFKTYTLVDGELVVKVDKVKDRFYDSDIAQTISFDLLDLDDEDREFLSDNVGVELANKKLYGKNEIMELLQCGNQKALNFLKLLFQMQYAIKVGKSYLIKAEDFDRFFEDFKGQEIVI